jgi:hypothetical protein
VSYTARLEHDPINVMAQGEGNFVVGGGSRSGTTVRWGDYTSMNVDPVDDCTFWFVNKYYVATGTQWTMRAGAFRFPDCGTPNLGLSVVPLTQRVCATTPAEYRVDAHGYSGFTSATNLSASVPAGGVPSFAPAIIAPVPGSSTLTIDASGIAAGAHTLTVSGDSTTPPLSRSRSVGLFVDTAAPTVSSPLLPADGSTSQPLAPLLSWSAADQARDYVVEVATDAGFGSIVFTGTPTTATSLQLPPVLAPGTQYFWRVRATNACGEGSNSSAATFTTRFAPGICPAGDVITSSFFDDVESGTNGWTTVPAAGTTWTRSTARPSSGAFAWLAVDVAVTSAQRLISPPINVPSGGNSPTLRFRHDVTMEPNTASTCFDGGFVEISTDNGGSWNALGLSAQLEDFYTGPLGTGELAWCGTRPYRTASFDLSAFAGQTIRLRFSALTDSSVGSVPHGWYVDDISVESCQLEPPNQAPQLVTPVAFSGFEDLPMPFGGIVPTDPDAGSAPVQLTMEVSTGTLTASNTGGVTATGSGTSTVVLTGPIASVHAYITSGAVTFLLGPDLSGSATLDLTLDDLGNSGAGGPLTATASVLINIAATDDAPQAVNDAPPALLEDAATTVIDVLANDTDIDGGPISVVFLTDVHPIEAGIAVIGGGDSHVEFTPAADFCGNMVEFLYVLAGGSSANATFAITCVNDAPRLAAVLPDVASGEETPLSIATAAGFVDVDDASLQYSLSSVPPLPGTVSIDAGSGVISGVPGAGSAGDYSITVTASDAEPLSAQRSFTLSILETAIFDDGFEQP